jgi:hypothetical protein
MIKIYGTEVKKIREEKHDKDIGTSVIKTEETDVMKAKGTSTFIIKIEGTGLIKIEGTEMIKITVACCSCFVNAPKESG